MKRGCLELKQNSRDLYDFVFQAFGFQFGLCFFF